MAQTFDAFLAMAKQIIKSKGDDRPLVIAVPKGRILKQLAERLSRFGMDAAELLADDRRLVRDLPELGFRFLLLKPDDVPTYVEYGVADVGVVGRDTLLERDYDLYIPLDLRIGVCKMVVAGLPNAQPHREPMRVATKFPHIAEKHFRSKGMHVETIYVQGSVELAPVTGLADVIVDIVESGETLRQNGLIVLEEIVEISSTVVVNRASMKLRRDPVRKLLSALA